MTMLPTDSTGLLTRATGLPAAPCPPSLDTASGAAAADSGRHPFSEPAARRADFPGDCTLLEVVEAITEVSQDEEEILATLCHMLNSGRIRLRGTFREQSPDSLLEG